MLKDIPAGIEYEVKEIDPDGYVVSSKNESGVIDTDKEVFFVNTKNVGIPTGAMTNTVAIVMLILLCTCGIVVLKIECHH